MSKKKVFPVKTLLLWQKLHKLTHKTEEFTNLWKHMSLCLSDQLLNVSMVTSRLGLVRESVQNLSLNLHQPIRELQSFSNGEAVRAPPPPVLLLLWMKVWTYWCREMFAATGWCIDCCVPSGSSVVLQQVQVQAAAARSSLQEALQQLRRITEQIQDSSSLMKDTNNTVRDTIQLMTHTHTAGQLTTWVYEIKDYKEI